MGVSCNAGFLNSTHKLCVHCSSYSDPVRTWYWHTLGGTHLEWYVLSAIMYLSTQLELSIPPQPTFYCNPIVSIATSALTHPSQQQQPCKGDVCTTADVPMICITAHLTPVQWTCLIHSAKVSRLGMFFKKFCPCEKVFGNVFQS